MTLFDHTNQVYDVAIIGGGIVGLATAREFLLRYPELRLIVIEKEPLLAQHQTGHNSGVLHAGIYYAPGSLKAKACVEGRAAMVHYCQEKGIRYELCGKLIVALTEAEVERLMMLWERAVTNQVPGVQLVGKDGIAEKEPYAQGIKAIWSPNTGIVDWSEVARAFADDVLAAGGSILTNTKVVRLSAHSSETRIGCVSSTNDDSEIRARFAITCAGLQSDRLAQMTEKNIGMKIVPFRGDYYQIAPEKAHFCRGMIYPVPEPDFPFLGVHLTRHIDGTVWAGPNAVLAFRREGYRRWDIHPVELAETLLYPGFWRLARKYWKTGLREMYRDCVKRAYVRELQKYTPSIQASDLIAEKSGVRAQALDIQGNLVDDFVIRQGDRIAHVQNAPSPAATSALVIARMIADAVEDKSSGAFGRSAMHGTGA